ncbi:MAG: tryptophan--tRNA ligase [Pseudomonadota bacterium]
MTKPRVLSGVQPTGNLHLGNYLGAIRNWVGLQDSHECLFMLADLHAITVPQDPAALTRNTRETAAAYIACGIDPEKSVIFPQSAVSMHAELAWILSCHAPLGWLNRMTQFKDKGQVAVKFNYKNEEQRKLIEKVMKEVEVKVIFSKDDFLVQKNTNDAKLGLYSYPVLMAADIIGYHATHVPVGEDQKQHLELARDIAGAFNRAYGVEFFPLPEPIILPTAARIMSLRDGSKKMSKSDPSDYARITLTDDADTIAKKLRKATSDSIEGVTYEPETRPEVANLLTIYAALTGTTPDAVASQFASAQTSAFKSALVDVAVDKLSPITTRMRELMDDTTALDAILKAGAGKARAIAAPILAETMKRIGFLNV